VATLYAHADRSEADLASLYFCMWICLPNGCYPRSQNFNRRDYAFEVELMLAVFFFHNRTRIRRHDEAYFANQTKLNNY
jgi:hypothetical protein